MKIAQICPFFLPAKGGVEEHVYYISKNLSKMGHQVTILTSDSLRDGKVKKRVEKINGLTIIRFSTLFSLGDFGKIWPGFITNLLTNKYDIVHVHSYRHFHCILAAIICKIKRIPCVITTHSPFHPIYVRRTLSKVLVFFYDSYLKFLIDKLFTKVINITTMEKKYFKHLNDERLVVIPNGIDKHIFKRIKPEKYKALIKKFGIKMSDNIILFVGRIHPTKNVEFLIHILKKFKIKRVRIVIVGPIQDRKYFSYLTEEIKKYGLSSRIIFTSVVSEEEKIILYDISKVFILPSIYEPFGIVILEAFARGKPVIAVDSDGPRYLIKNGENGFLVRYGDVESAAKYIKLLLKDRKLYRKISTNNIKKAKQFAWEKIVKKIIKVYEEAIKEYNH